MSTVKRLRDLPLLTQLMIVFAFLSAATTAVATMTLTSLSSQRMHNVLRDRAQRIAQRLQRQLEPVIESKDRLTARELFNSYASDHELDGVAVYAANGELIEGRGIHPVQLPSIDAPLEPGRKHVVAVANIRAVAGPIGHLYLSFSTRLNDELEGRQVRIASGVGICIALCALILAVWTSRGIARRLVSIAAAANRMAAGDWSHAALEDRAKDEIGELAQAFNVMVSELSRVSKENAQLVSTEHARLEELVSNRTKELEQGREMFRLMAESTNAIPFTLDLKRSCFTYLGAEGLIDLGLPPSAPDSCTPLDIVIPRETNQEIRQRFDECENGSFEFVTWLCPTGGRRAEMRWTGTCELTAEAKILRGLMLDITELRRLSRELSAAQKLESVGRLAAGVAHEINTPVQFVSDNIQFLRTSILDIASVIQAYRNLQRVVKSSADAGSTADLAIEADKAAAAEKSVDFDYIMENAPLAVESSIEGLGRIATIVRSMKEFAHPDQAEKALADLNQAIRSTLVIAHNEYKYVAEIHTNFGDLPLVPCHLGEINQVVLNLLVNAAHAISDVVKDSGERGSLTVSTRLDGNEVEISIADSGTGIPVAARDKIFDPFFTTKEVGKGTGQGLALAHSIVVNKHGGTLHFKTECASGTTFFIRLPIGTSGDGEEARQAAA